MIVLDGDTILLQWTKDQWCGPEVHHKCDYNHLFHKHVTRIGGRRRPIETYPPSWKMHSLLESEDYSAMSYRSRIFRDVAGSAAPEGTPLYHLHDSTLIVDVDNSHGSPVLQNTLIKREYE